VFTGLVEGKGELVSLERRGEELRLRLRPFFVWERPRLGESVAVNGVCLTVESWNPSGPLFTVYASAETVSCTCLAALRSGSHVNLERALALGDRLGGHLVSGHVDTVAVVDQISTAGQSRCFRMVFDQEWSAQIIPKGSVALDGVSLTVNKCGSGFLEVNVIPETLRSTTLGEWSAGRRVHLETDMIGKYVGHLLSPYLEREETKGGTSLGLTLEFLRENGF